MKKLLLLLCLYSSSLTGSLLAQDYEIENNRVKLNTQVQFQPGTAILLPESDAALIIIKQYLAEKLSISLLRVEAHAFTAANAETNQLLSEKRAVAICQRLIQLGADCQRLLPVGFGSSKPVLDNATEKSRAANTRISFVNAALRGKAIGGMPVDGGGRIVENPCY